MKPETFYARIYGNNEDEYQDLFVYLGCEDAEVIDCEIKIPIMINPSHIRADVQEWLREVSDKWLGDLKFETLVTKPILAP